MEGKRSKRARLNFVQNRSFLTLKKDNPFPMKLRAVRPTFSSSFVKVETAENASGKMKTMVTS